MSAIGENIKMSRERRNLSQQELAMKVRVGTGTIEKYESGEKLPDIQTILNISTALDTPASELLEKAYQTNPSGIDHEIKQLVKEIGTKKAKLILRKAKEFSEDDFLRAMQMLYEIKHKKVNNDV
ncbi:helix-turn-helix domain-containing protein [Bacillus canaveralius]|uniref:helix-turn-helix domain-containing protein n=1 Tax=Bacillus canaveralius TaxID=1403243 RepID=UPI000F79AB64|nr:helix-turn-helix transcriptional regulator [Bacillus canaveralius]RSK45305.1 XRE family transcriptional regulator [Bacillus canaveralius]